VILALVSAGSIAYCVRGYLTIDALPKVGTAMRLPPEFNRMRWYGRGPHENYDSRRHGARMGIHEGSVADQYVPYIRPQENGNKSNVEWLTLTNGAQVGLLITSSGLNMSAHHYSLENLTAATHTVDLVDSGYITLNVDQFQSGLGTGPMGKSVLEENLLNHASYQFTYRMAPVDLSTGDLAERLSYAVPARP